MAQPPAYNRVKDFGADYGDQTDNQAINTELDAVSASVNGIRANLAKIQRDDGGLRDGIVTKDSLAQSLKDELYAEFSGNINDSVLEAQQAAADATNAAAAANADAATASAAQQAAQTASTAAQASASSASASQSAAFTSANAASASATAASGSASTASTAATTATGAAAAAVQARDEAVPAAATATTKAAQAVSSAAAAAADAALAEQWATKTDGPVDGVEFSAKHYAQLAEAGMGLPVYATGSIPTTNVGPIFVSGHGPMGWDGARYVVTNGEHGQCRFVYVSATECRLMPYNGNGLVINGKQYRIPAAGIPLPIASVAGGIGSTNYIYAKDDGSGGISLEGVTTNHVRHSDGVEIKSGDPTRTLVGITYKNVAGQFQFDGFVPGVASWFNRYSNVGRASAYLAGTSSASPVPVGTAINAWVWSGEALEYGTAGVITSDTAGVAPSLVIFLDGVADTASYGTIPTANGSIPAGLYAVRTGLAEGFHYIEPRLSSGGSGTAYLTCGYFVSNKR
ncbi:hypothetical protein [Achromobacter xylosoxidans]|uniref:hypothetical protein n=1 Tax=Alcaligenes xylosoxydans xylosoxydans TaxID=85698 RepID=UPI001EEA9CC3|nr:hypothetical protein [Achromobacter xylosoxidans]